ncbi:MAG TPA: hypothetical protein VG308_08545 [Stellaceae bacterium]|nr:hypothetical protein [Stellaceae bacterium]
MLAQLESNTLENTSPSGCMMNEADDREQVVDDAGSMPAPLPRRPWKTPQVIFADAALAQNMCLLNIDHLGGYAS